jgi:hypothetical protein
MQLTVPRKNVAIQSQRPEDARRNPIPLFPFQKIASIKMGLKQKVALGFLCGQKHSGAREGAPLV